MINSKKMTIVIDRCNSSYGNKYRIYEYCPSITKLFWENYEKLTLQRYIRFILELLKGYKVYYLEVNNEIVAYSVISRGGGRYKFASKEDIVVGPYYVLSEYRGKKYSETLVSELLHYEGIKYRYAYDWIKKDNIPSLKCSKATGFVEYATADLIMPFRAIRIRNDALGEYIILKNSHTED